MAYLFLYLLLLSLFSHSMHFAQRRKGDLLIIIPINYVIAAAASIVIVFIDDGAVPWNNRLVMTLGVINGVVFFVHLLFIPVYHLERLLGFGLVGCHGPRGDRWNKLAYFRRVIDRFKTRYASEQQLEEVIRWFADHGFNGLRVGGRPRVAVVATKRASRPLESVDVNIMMSVPGAPPAPRVEPSA